MPGKANSLYQRFALPVFLLIIVTTVIPYCFRIWAGNGERDSLFFIGAQPLRRLWSRFVIISYVGQWFKYAAMSAMEFDRYLAESGKRMKRIRIRKC